MMEGMLIQMARSGQIAGKVTINVNVQAVRKIILCYMVTSPQNMVWEQKSEQTKHLERRL